MRVEHVHVPPTTDADFFIDPMLDVASRIDGAAWCMAAHRTGVVPVFDPRSWIWERTGRTLAWALQGYTVKSRRSP